MAKLAWTPWHQVVKRRDDVRTGELSLATFAANLYFVMMDEAKLVYQDPREFFALTYPTYNLRELFKKVVLRLAGKKEKAVRQLALPYGGGKTHNNACIANSHCFSSSCGLTPRAATWWVSVSIKYAIRVVKLII